MKLQTSKVNNLNMFKSKKGQIYIVVALLVCASLAGIFSFAISTKHDPKDVALKDLCLQLKSESQNTVNFAIKNKQDVFGNYNYFAKNYFNYAKSITYYFGFVYVLTYNNLTFTRNYLDLPVNVSYDSNSYELKNYPTNDVFEMISSKPNSVSFIYANNLYNYSTQGNVKLDIVCIYRKNQNDLVIVT